MVVEMNRASKKKSDLQACANQKLGINVMGNQFIQILQKECVRKIYMITAPMAMDPASFGLHAALTYEEVRQTAQLHRLGEEDSIGRPVRLSGSPGCLGEHNGIREGGQGISFLASSHAKGCGPEGQEHHLSRISQQYRIECRSAADLLKQLQEEVSELRQERPRKKIERDDDLMSMPSSFDVVSKGPSERCMYRSSFY